MPGNVYPVPDVRNPFLGVHFSRAQLVDWRTKELVMDFRVEAKDETIHVLNPISPAFTSSMELARIVADRHFAT